MSRPTTYESSSRIYCATSRSSSGGSNLRQQVQATAQLQESWDMIMMSTKRWACLRTRSFTGPTAADQAAGDDVPLLRHIPKAALGLHGPPGSRATILGLVPLQDSPEQKDQNEGQLGIQTARFQALQKPGPCGPGQEMELSEDHQKRRHPTEILTVLLQCAADWMWQTIQ